MPRDRRTGGRWTPGQRLKNDVILGAIRVALRVAAAMPAWAVTAGCRAIGLLAWAVVASSRRAAAARLGGAGARRAFLRVAELFADTVLLLDPHEPVGRGLSLPDDSRRVFAGAVAEGRGVVFVTAHLGPWERMAALLAAEGHPVAVIARESYDPRLTRLYGSLRRPRGVRAIYRGRPGAARRTLEALRQGSAVGVLVDLPGRTQAVPAPLFGREQPVALGAARLALASGAALLVGAPVPAPGGRAIAITRIEVGPGRGAAAARALTQRLAAELSRRIEREPEAWLGILAPR